MNKFGAMTLLSVTALSLGFGAFISRAHAEIGVNAGADVNVNLGYGNDHRDGDNDRNDGDRHDDEKKGGDTSDGRMYKGSDDHRFSGVTGTVTAVSGTTITIHNNRDNMNYTVLAADTKIYKGPTVKALADIKVGDFIIVEGSLSGSSVTANRILDTSFDMNFPENGKWDNFKSGIMGTVTASSTTTLTVKAKDGTVYTVATGEAKFQKEKGTAITMSDIKVGDTVLIQGAVTGTNVIAKNVFDTQIAVQKMEDRKDNGNHYGFFHRFGNFFRNIFKARTHTEVSSNLNDHTYRLASYNGTTIASDQNYTLAFNDGKISAKFCNSMNGSYSLKDKVVTATLASTLMACSDANLMAMETSFGAALQEGAMLTADKDARTLTLKSKTGTTFVFAKQ